MVSSKKLRSSMKALHQAMANLRPVAAICIQGGKTDSFRGLNSSLNSIYCTISTISPSSSSSSSSSSSFSSSSSLDASLPKQQLEGAISEFPATLPAFSDRFFFSPRISKSILEENKSDGVTMVMEMTSNDPYRDFRLSMEEMVEAHGLREWPQLQKLLRSYLRLNDQETHEIILLAFADLLLRLIRGNQDDN